MALAIGLVVGNIIQPGDGLNIDSVSGKGQELAEDAHESGGTLDFIQGIIPESMLSALTEGSVLQALFVALLVGFAAETGDATGSVLELGRAKLERKGCDLLVVNEVGVDKTFGADETTVHVLTRGSADVVDIGPASKSVVSHGIWDVVVGSTVAH